MTIFNRTWRTACLFGLALAALAAMSPSRRVPTGAADGGTSAAAEAPRECLLLDFGWKFALGDASTVEGDFGYGRDLLFAKAGESGGAVAPGFDDSAWRSLDLPHDWAVELDFVQVKDENVLAHGFKPVGRQFPRTTVGWYRRAFVVPRADEGRRLAVKFDGVFRDGQVWLNGHFLGRNLSGYSEFLLDITDYVEYGGRNVLVVRVDAGLYEGWFYEGAGIYRHVWLQKYGPVHIPEYGVFVRAEVGPEGAAVLVDTRVLNRSLADVQAELRTSVLDDQGRTVTESGPEGLRLAAGRSADVAQKVMVERPRLWSLETPHLYRLVSEVLSAGRVVDRRETEFGIRTLLFDKDKGFFLNGRPVKIQGVCCHQDHAGVGSALPDALQYYRVSRLKDMGCNAYRSSHNPPTTELLQACDRLGLLVMDENRLLGSGPEVMSQWERLILRDRNHPSVIAWSLGNEEFTVQDTPVGRRLAQTMKQRQRELDPSRLCTFGGNNGKNFAGTNEVVDIRGFNYHLDEIDAYRKEHPDQVLWGSETASTVCTRGVYANDPERGTVADLDQNFPPWASTAETWWSLYAARPWLLGGFAWTGFDYRGEPTPYGWPCINSHFGIMDMCGFPKNNFYYYQAWWTDRDVLHIAPHWNWKGREGRPIDVWCQSNCDAVELFLNGRSLGRKTMPRWSHLEWRVTYEPGVLSAKGWKDGRVLTARVETTGEPAVLRLEPDRTAIRADGEDLVVIGVRAEDDRGRDVPTAGNLVRFEVGPGARIIGVGNGDPSSHEPDIFLQGGWQRRLFNGRAQVIVQAGRQAGSIRLKASSDGLKPAEAVVTAAPAPPRPRVD